jgi:hypothetical protein
MVLIERVTAGDCDATCNDCMRPRADALHIVQSKVSIGVSQIHNSLERDSEESIRALRSFLESQGALFNSIVSAQMDDGSYRGIRATQVIEKDEVILSIPEHLLLSLNSARGDPDIARLLSLTQNRVALSDEQLLAVHLLHEVYKGASSSFHLYIKTLPTSFDSLLYLKEDEIDDALQFDHAIRAAHESKRRLVESWKVVKLVLRRLMSGKAFGLGHYCWAIGVIQSRTMFLPGDDIGCLTPYGDLHNHECPRPPPITPDVFREREVNEDHEDPTVSGEGFFDEKQKRYILVTRQRVPAGSQVYLTYGRYTNLELLDMYGFTINDNPNDTCLLPIGLFPELIQKHLACQSECFLHVDGNPSFDLIRAVRLGVLHDKERKKWAFLVLDDQPVNPESERRALDVISRVVHSRLSSVTSLEDDERLAIALAAPSQARTRGFAHAAAINWRMQQKRIMERYLDRACSKMKMIH